LQPAHGVRTNRCRFTPDRARRVALGRRRRGVVDDDRGRLGRSVVALVHAQIRGERRWLVGRVRDALQHRKQLDIPPLRGPQAEQPLPALVGGIREQVRLALLRQQLAPGDAGLHEAPQGLPRRVVQGPLQLSEKAARAWF
jgi:hypothetical protein